MQPSNMWYYCEEKMISNNTYPDLSNYYYVAKQKQTKIYMFFFWVNATAKKQTF